MTDSLGFNRIVRFSQTIQTFWRKLEIHFGISFWKFMRLLFWHNLHIFSIIVISAINHIIQLSFINICLIINLLIHNEIFDCIFIRIWKLNIGICAWLQNIVRNSLIIFIIKLSGYFFLRFSVLDFINEWFLFRNWFWWFFILLT